VIGAGDVVQQAAPISFRGVEHRAAKRFLEGTHRTCSPEETLERIRPLFPMAGITRLADVTGLDRIGISTILAMRPNAPTLANSSGKGFTLVAATVSAAMEGIELQLAETFHVHEGTAHGDSVRATHRELERDGLVCPLELLPLAHSSLFNADMPEYWTMGFDLIQQRPMAVPYALVTMSAEARKYSQVWFQVGSNGLASGNVFLEAVCSALSEVIERDAVTCTELEWGTSRAPVASVDLDSVPYATVNALVDGLRDAGLLPLLLDCTVDTEVPTYRATLLDEALTSSGTFGGYGAHLDPEVAMIRALTEAVQGRTVYIAGSRDDLMTLEHRRLRRRGMAGVLQQARDMKRETAVLRESQAGPTFEEDCATLLGHLQAAGFEHAVVVDLASPELGISVVRVVVPGLEGYHSFQYYAPGPRGRAALDGGHR
jgi:ribosomal protein S12 methylthiotransferase accessory factor